MKEFELDVHQETIAVSVADEGGGEVRYVGEIHDGNHDLTENLHSTVGTLVKCRP